MEQLFCEDDSGQQQKQQQQQNVSIPLTCKQYPIFTFCFVFVFYRIGQLLESLAGMETDSEENKTENEDSLG